MKTRKNCFHLGFGDGMTSHDFDHTPGFLCVVVLNTGMTTPVQFCKNKSYTHYLMAGNVGETISALPHAFSSTE